MNIILIEEIHPMDNEEHPARSTRFFIDIRDFTPALDLVARSNRCVDRDRFSRVEASVHVDREILGQASRAVNAR